MKILIALLIVVVVAMSSCTHRHDTYTCACYGSVSGHNYELDEKSGPYELCKALQVRDGWDSCMIFKKE